MDSHQRFMRRNFLFENMEIMLRESAYHRTHDEDEKLPAIPVWRWGSVEGEANGIF